MTVISKEPVCPDCGALLTKLVHAAEQAAVNRAETAAAIHSNYPIESEWDKGYAQGRKDASAAIRARFNASRRQG